MKAIFVLAICVVNVFSNEVQVDDIKRMKEPPTKPPEIIRGKKSLKKQNEKLKTLVNTIYEFNAYHEDDEHLRYDVPPTISDKTTNSLRANTVVAISNNNAPLEVLDQPQTVLHESNSLNGLQNTPEKILSI